ncbi:MAG TPA: TadE/TadG family type IV pilus assembly protein [Actinospica sp.]|nr:TadE/TadG family type IV pilus assembly protein [Actinospica sp.]
MQARRRRADRESGASAIELVLWTPVLFLVMFAAVQFGLDLFAQHVAASAAQEGARQARDTAYGDQTWQSDSTRYAEKWATDLIGGLIVPNSLNSTANPDTAIDLNTAQNPEVGVTVNFSVVSVIPFMPLNVSASSEGPVECFYNDAGQCVGN